MFAATILVGIRGLPSMLERITTHLRIAGIRTEVGNRQ
jgi:hypothetical protein